MAVDTAAEISKKSRSSFYYAFNLLPEKKREAMNRVYAFCRITDDIVDENSLPEEEKRTKLNQWRESLKLALAGEGETALLQNLGESIRNFSIPEKPFYELIDGMEMDLNEQRYETFEELKQYCYYAASTVGLMCIPIFGYRHQETVDYAVNLGIALQLTNILRDVYSDIQEGRLYLPMEDMRRFGYSEDDLKNKVYNEKFIALMQYLAERAEEFFREADSHLHKEDKKNMFPARAMQRIYFSLLKKLKRKNYNVFEGKIRVGSVKKLFLALGIWFKYNVLYR